MAPQSYFTHSFSREDSSLQKLYRSSKVIYLRLDNSRNLIFDVIKDRHGIPGEKNLDEAIEVVADMLTEFKFKGSNELFQFNVKERLVEVMKKVLLSNDDCIPQEQEETS